jgi:EAL domain-containing protein (putative c-di-GMP-specific phosphodiesterase class I)
VYYQPQVDIKTRRIKSAEALVRWNHPKLGMLESKRFIPIAESIGFIASIDEWVLRSARAQLRAWKDAGNAPPCVTVNISSRTFRNPAFAETIMGTLDDDGLSAECLQLEIKESSALGYNERNIGLLKNLVAKGVGISIDDFGTGYSSLHQLKKFPVTRLKIDQSLVKDVATDADSRTLISAMTAMAHKMNILVVPEGVETEEQLSFLREAECDEAQGYLFSAPVSPERFSELMAASNIAGHIPGRSSFRSILSKVFPFLF